MNGTTIKVIAEHSEISEGVIYRHFESKDQLFFEAVVEPGLILFGHPTLTAALLP